MISYFILINILDISNSDNFVMYFKLLDSSIIPSSSDSLSI